MTDAEHGQPQQLSVVTTTTEGIRVLSLAGEIDHHTAPALRQALNASGTAHSRIVVDMRQVTFMDSTGINILINTHRTLTRAGGWLRLTGPTPPVQRVLQLVGIDRLIDCHDTLHHALNP